MKGILIFAGIFDTCSFSRDRDQVFDQEPKAVFDIIRYCSHKALTDLSIPVGKLVVIWPNCV